MSEVRVGTSIIIVKYGKVLAGRRKGSHAAGLVSFPGGHLDFGEEWHECAVREVREECGPNLKIQLIRDRAGRLDWATTNDIMPQYGKHYITLFLVANWKAGEPVNTEPDKCEGWEWITFDELKALGDKTAQWIPIRWIEINRYNIGI